MWASNAKGSNAIANAEKVYETLKETQDDLPKKIVEGSMPRETSSNNDEVKATGNRKRVFGTCK